jgi:hypothetical protein
LLSRQDVFIPAKKVQILEEGVSPHKGVGPFFRKRIYLQAFADNGVNEECKQCGENRNQGSG